MKNTDAKSAPEGVASITVSGGLECYTEISRKIRRLHSLPTDCCKVDLEVYTASASYNTVIPSLQEYTPLIEEKATWLLLNFVCALDVCFFVF